MKELSWIRCKGDVWCNLNTVNLSHEHFEGMEGVYIIWHGGSPSNTVYIGQGAIKDRLAKHKEEQKIKQYSNLGLFVTWASVSDNERDGVEAFLIQKLNPLENVQKLSNNIIEVSLPW